MAQETAVPSKTQELRDRLDREIERWERDCEVLNNSLEHPDLGNGYCGRYAGLISLERNEKMAEDKRKLEALRDRLGKIRFTRELDLDLDAMEAMGFEISNLSSAFALPSPIIYASFNRQSESERKDPSMPIVEISIDLYRRGADIRTYESAQTCDWRIRDIGSVRVSARDAREGTVGSIYILYPRETKEYSFGISKNYFFPSPDHQARHLITCETRSVNAALTGTS